MKRFRAVGAIAANAAYVLAVQLLGLVTLSPADFGSFSIQYLAYAFGASLSLSIISEAFLRSEIRDNVLVHWRDYSSVTVYLALAMGLVTFALSWAFEPLRAVSVIGAIAVTASVYRGSARYFSLRRGEFRGVLPGDVAGLAVSISVWAFYFLGGSRDLSMMSTAWASGAVASAVLSKWPRLLEPRSIARWCKQHAVHIRPLLKDSLLMDAGAIGTPYLLAPVLGLAQFGIYRAVSNVAAPVRLALNPIRPQIAAAPIAGQRSMRRVATVVAVSILFGGGAFGGLAVVGVLDVYLGSLTDLVPFAIPTAVFVTANFMGHYFYIVARAHLSGSRLFAGRIIQTVLAVVVPLSGALLGGLTGAVWGFAAGTLLSSLSWMVLIIRPTKPVL
ncbi:hypothetical protein [Salinibacterium sp. M195]|uniref:hypothetical protein n=1 Tax=Salinibacterium sp. M195 TaxID=2583374 RepID=UPI001C63267C|nr:hypothetical protein [Salinibacterium sp. M195]QYH34847.1 hypothetical protein FFT87_02160 [Salinibacterium sp. M195]